MREGQVEKAAVEDVHMEYRPSVTLAEVSEVPGLEGEHAEPSQPQTELVLGTNANIPTSNNF